MKKRLLSVLLAFAMLFSLLSLMSSAQTYEGTCGDGISWSLDTASGVLNITGAGVMSGHPWSDHDKDIKTVKISNGITSIVSDAFSGLSNLSVVTIPDSVTEICYSAFSNCTALKSVAIPDSVTSIGTSAFSGCKGLTEVTLPNGILAIGDYVFGSCTALKSVTVPDSVTSIGYESFFGCSALENVNFGEKVERINNFAFAECAALKSVTVPAGVTAVCYSAFSDCSALASVTVPDSVTSIDMYAFYHCGGIKDVYYGGSETKWEQISVSYYNDDLLNANIHYEHIHNWGEWVFNNDATLEDNGTKTRVCHSEPGHTETVIAEGTKLDKPKTEFKDVAQTAFYAEPVEWAVAKDITKGTGDTTFSPANKCTRGQVVTFLWRANGSPEPKTTVNPFTDVKSDGFYYKAVLWAVENNITSGLSATTFGPGKECTRAQVVTFLWRAKGEPAPASTSHPFTDVKSDGFYFKAMLWAVENNITNGTTATTFGPGKTCTRGQVVTFLYRAFK